MLYENFAEGTMTEEFERFCCSETKLIHLISQYEQLLQSRPTILNGLATVSKKNLNVGDWTVGSGGMVHGGPAHTEYRVNCFTAVVVGGFSQAIQDPATHYEGDVQYNSVNLLYEILITVKQSKVYFAKKAVLVKHLERRLGDVAFENMFNYEYKAALRDVDQGDGGDDQVGGGRAEVDVLNAQVGDGQAPPIKHKVNGKAINERGPSLGYAKDAGVLLQLWNTLGPDRARTYVLGLVKTRMRRMKVTYHKAT